MKPLKMTIETVSLELLKQSFSPEELKLFKELCHRIDEAPDIQFNPQSHGYFCTIEGNYKEILKVFHEFAKIGYKELRERFLDDLLSNSCLSVICPFSISKHVLSHEGRMSEKDWEVYFSNMDYQDLEARTEKEYEEERKEEIEEDQDEFNGRDDFPHGWFPKPKSPKTMEMQPQPKEHLTNPNIVVK